MSFLARTEEQLEKLKSLLPTTETLKMAYRHYLPDYLGEIESQKKKNSQTSQLQEDAK